MEELNGPGYGEYSNDFPIEQIDESHYVFRRGSTQVHIQTFEASAENDDVQANVTLKDGLVTLLSGLFGMLIVVITLVIKASAAATNHITEAVVNQYMIFLYVLCLLFTIYYNFMAGFFTKDIIKFAKSSKSTNRWLKGVIIIFGMAIIFKDGIDILAYIVSGNHNCTENHIVAAMSGFHLVFVMSQTFFLLKYSKVFIQDRSFAPKLGLMFLIATNLSTWIVSVVSETIHALHVKNGHLTSDTHHGLIGHHAQQNSNTKSNESSTPYADVNEVKHSELFQVLVSEENIDQSCLCSAQICIMMHAVEKFLFPFLIEFSLVASCLLYVTWGNVLKRPPPCEGVVRPSHKLYKSYSGIGLGCLTIFITMIVMIILGTTGLNNSDDNFWNTLNIYNSFLITLELSMLTVCYLGFYLFLKISRPLTEGHSDILDISLLLICILGPLILNTFSMLAVIAGPDNKDNGDWVLSLLCPMCDTLQCVCQAIFVLYGLKREPETSDRSKETIKQVKKRFQAVFNERVNRNIMEQENNSDINSDNFSGNFPNKFIRSRQNSVTSVISAIACAPKIRPTPQIYGDQLFASNVKSAKSTVENNEQEIQTKINVLHSSKIAKQNGKNGKIPRIILTDETQNSTPLLDIANDDRISLNSVSSTDSIGAASDLIEKASYQPARTVIKIVSKSHVARPTRQRIILRNIIMYLLLSNAALWMFMSLDGTAFSVRFYQSTFFSPSVWTTILMICRPLSIFFRMHSAGCLFEIWSYA